MIEERYIELINKELDGLNLESESQELERHLAENEEALKYYDELLRTASALKRSEQVEPPSYLKTHILNSIRSLPIPAASGFGWIKKIAEAVRQRPFPKYAIVFASGLCLGILILVLANPWRQEETPDISKLSGSMLLPSELTRLQRIDSVAVDGSGFRAVFRTFHGEGKLMLDFSLASVENVRLELSADQEELKFVAVNRLGGTENDVMATGGRVIFTGTKSEHSVIVYSEVGGPQQPIEARVFKGGTAVQTVKVRTN